MACFGDVGKLFNDEMAVSQNLIYKLRQDNRRVTSLIYEISYIFNLCNISNIIDVSM